MNSQVSMSPSAQDCNSLLSRSPQCFLFFCFFFGLVLFWFVCLFLVVVVFCLFILEAVQEQQKPRLILHVCKSLSLSCQEARPGFDSKQSHRLSVLFLGSLVPRPHPAHISLPVY